MRFHTWRGSIPSRMRSKLTHAVGVGDLRRKVRLLHGRQHLRLRVPHWRGIIFIGIEEKVRPVPDRGRTSSGKPPAAASSPPRRAASSGRCKRWALRILNLRASRFFDLDFSAWRVARRAAATRLVSNVCGASLDGGVSKRPLHLAMVGRFPMSGWVRAWHDWIPTTRWR